MTVTGLTILFLQMCQGSPVPVSSIFYIDRTTEVFKGSYFMDDPPKPINPSGSSSSWVVLHTDQSLLAQELGHSNGSLR